MNNAVIASNMANEDLVPQKELVYNALLCFNVTTRWSVTQNHMERCS